MLVPRKKRKKASKITFFSLTRVSRERFVSREIYCSVSVAKFKHQNRNKIITEIWQRSSTHESLFGIFFSIALYQISNLTARTIHEHESQNRSRACAMFLRSRSPFCVTIIPSFAHLQHSRTVPAPVIHSRAFGLLSLRGCVQSCIWSQTRIRSSTMTTILTEIE